MPDGPQTNSDSSVNSIAVPPVQDAATSSDSSGVEPKIQPVPVPLAPKAPNPKPDPFAPVPVTPSDVKSSRQSPSLSSTPSSSQHANSQSRVKIKTPPIMWQQTQEILSKIETLLGGKVVSYFTSGTISSGDVKYFHAHLKNIGFQDRLFFVVVSPGGDGMSAYRIAYLLRNYCKELVIVLPEKAASAATMLCLAADSLMMSPLSYLTAVDTSMAHPLNPKGPDNRPVRVELEEVKRAISVLENSGSGDQDKVDIYKTIFNYIHPVAFGSMERSSNLSEMLCSDILDLRQSPPDMEEKKILVDKLNHDFPSHGYPIIKKKARELGLNVVDTGSDLDNLLWDYLNIVRYIMEPVRTDFTDSYFHSEVIPTLIESVDRRFVVKDVIERRLDPIIKGWTTTKEEYKWYSTYESEVDGKKKLNISLIDF